MTRRLAPLLAALALTAAACTGSSTPPPESTTTTASPPGTSTSVPPTTAPPATTTAPPPEAPYLLVPRLAADTTAVYDTRTTYRTTSSGELPPEALTVEVTGERFHAAFGFEVLTIWEVLIDPQVIEVFGTQGDGDEDVSGRGRFAVAGAGLEPAALDLPVVLFPDSRGAVTDGLAPSPGGTGEPLSMARALDALPGPPLPATPVDVGDEWAVGPMSLPWIGAETLLAEGTARVAGTSRVDGAFTVDIELELALSAAARPLAAVAEALLELEGTSDGRVAGIGRREVELLTTEAELGPAAGTIGVPSGRVTGTYRFDPVRGLFAAISTDSRLVAELSLLDELGPFAGSYVVESRTEARLTRVDEGAPPLPVDADDVAFLSLPADVAGYEYEDLDPLRAEELLNRLGLLLDDPLAGVAGLQLVPDEGGAPGIDVLAFYPLGFARGDPSLADGLAAVVTGEFEAEVGERVELGGASVLRFQSEGETWLVAATNTRLLVGVGGDDVPEDAFAAVMAANADEHRWQAGECHDLGSGEAFDPPFAPFGIETLVPCWRPHSVEVSGAQTLDDPAGAARPDDLDERSARFCDESFLDYTGTLPSETRLSGVSYLPDEAEWGEGDRYLACVVSAVDDAGLVAATTEWLRLGGERHRLRLETGTCFDGPLSSVPVDCGGPHVQEVVGAVTLDEPPDAPYPGDDEFFALVDERCADVLVGYADDVSRDGAELEASAFGGGAFAWEQGVREFACAAVGRDRDGAVVRVVRSFADEWRPLGPADDVFSA